MTIYVDRLKDQCLPPGHSHSTAKKFTCRLFTDPTDDLTGLKAFAVSCGIPEDSLHMTVMPHYDILLCKRADAVSKSAVEVDDSRALDIEQAWRRFWNAKAT